MARFVIAGSLNCPHYAQLEDLADRLSINLPNFDVHKMPILDSNWATWLDTTCKKNNWIHRKSPIVWRELVERGGKGMYIGGFNEFAEYAKCYYNFESDMDTAKMKTIRDENMEESIADMKKAAEKQRKIVLTKVCLINASNHAAYHLIPLLAAGELLSHDSKIVLTLHDTPENKEVIEGVAMEAFDLGYDSLVSVEVETKMEAAARDASFIIIFDDECFKRSADESHEQWIERNGRRYRDMGRSIDARCRKDAKVIVTGRELLNFRAHNLARVVERVRREHVVACPRILERRCKAVVGGKLNVRSTDVRDVVVWGDCSTNADPNCYYVRPPVAKVHNFDGAIHGPSWYSRPLVEIATDRKWLSGDFCVEMHERRISSQKLMRQCSSMSEGTSIAQFLSDWVNGCNEITSMGVYATGQYGIEDCFFSLPVRFAGDGTYMIVDDLEMDESEKSKLAMVKDALDSQLIEEKDEKQPEEKEEEKQENKNSEDKNEKDEKDDGSKKQQLVSEDNKTSHVENNALVTEKQEEGLKEADEAYEPPTHQDILNDLKE